MKKIIFYAATILVIVSCNKDDMGQSGTKSNNTTNFEEPSQINIYSKKVYSPEEYCDMVGASFDDYLDCINFSDYNVIIKKMIYSIFEDNAGAVDKVVAEETGSCLSKAREQWSVKIFNYTYKTESYTGEPIVLSAALCVPVLNDGSVHTLSAMTLGQPHMPQEKEFCPTMNGNILMARVAYNHAVVVPDYQGRGITSSTPYSSLHTHAHAVQAIDAALAAEVILEKEGFALAHDFSLYNIGVSEGGETSFETHKIIENDLPVTLKEKINLKLTFCANGIAFHARYVDSRLKAYVYNESTHKYEMDFYKDAFDCLSEEEKQGHSGEEFYSSDLLKDDRLIADAPVFELLKEGVQKNDIAENWNPQHSITLAASRDDDDVFFEENTQYLYNLLKNTPSGNPNRNVKLLPFNTPVFSFVSGLIGPDYMIAHIAADVCCFVHAIRYEDPGSEPVQVGFSDDLYNNLKAK